LDYFKSSNMKKQFLFIIIVSILGTSLQGQKIQVSVFAPGGGYDTLSNGYQVHYTFGEPITGSQTGTSIRTRSGFENLLGGSIVTSINPAKIDDALLIYPNPTSDRMFIRHSSRELKTKVFTVLGRLVLDQSNREIPATISLETLPPGPYFLRLNIVGKGIITYKIFKL